MEDNKKTGYSLNDLAEKSGIPQRTIRFYIARGLLAGPGEVGRYAVYTQEHLDRLLDIKAKKQSGLLLYEIAVHEKGVPEFVSEPTSWMEFNISNDVKISVRSDIAPWRMKQIKKVIGEMSPKIKTLNREEEKRRHKHKPKQPMKF
jgi:DNA-binding transcriptional MerR regulator